MISIKDRKNKDIRNNQHRNDSILCPFFNSCTAAGKKEFNGEKEYSPP